MASPPSRDRLPPINEIRSALEYKRSMPS
jgi:hypothetical protein